MPPATAAGRNWAAIPPVPIQLRTRSARARDPIFRPTAHIGAVNPKCWKRYPSHVAHALAAKELRIVKSSGGIGGQKKRKNWREGKGAKRLRSRVPGREGMWAGREEVKKDGEGKWVYVD
ncbi:hypothetical protein VTL71DRAFT_15791 [Oculimacula yallundae]|uniref:Uncharacterized protein n=1 Tax=Oculimacula yallundae TaxID=86028 RepID=A0ABR4CCN7_9HELO